MLKKHVAPLLAAVDVLVVPTVPTMYTRAQVLAEPYRTNRNLGYYTNFVNLLDLAALAVPTWPARRRATRRRHADPAGGQRPHAGGPRDAPAYCVGTDARSHRAAAAPAQWASAARGHGRCGCSRRAPERPATQLPVDRARWAPGADLPHCAVLSSVCAAQSTPPRPGLVRDATDAGRAIDMEVWRLPMRHYGSFVALVPSPLSIGRVELEDGSWVQGFLCESWALAGAEEISRFGAWRAWLAQK